MDIKKIFKGFTNLEACEIIKKCDLEFDEIPIAIMLLADKKPRSFICDEYNLSTGKYHYMLNRIIPKIQFYIKFKLFN